MRTTGTFQDIYTAAKNYYQGGDTYGGRPMQPVVRRENRKWMLESGVHPALDADFEVTLEEFDSWFYEAYNSNYEPSEADIDDFVAAHTE